MKANTQCKPYRVVRFIVTIVSQQYTFHSCYVFRKSWLKCVVEENQQPPAITFSFDKTARA